MTVQHEVEPAQQQRQEHHGNQHGRGCYWDLRECRWVCSHERRTAPEELPAES